MTKVGESESVQTTLAGNFRLTASKSDTDFLKTSAFNWKDTIERKQITADKRIVFFIALKFDAISEDWIQAGTNLG